MLRQIKNFVKSFLPTWVIEAVMRRRAQRILAPVPSKQFSVAPLLAAADFDHGQIFAAQSEFASDWQASHAAITAETTQDRIGSSVSPGDRQALYQVVRSFKPRRVLEFGTHIGMSTYYISKALEANGGGEITTVDIADVNAEDGPWRGAGLAKPPAEITERLGLADMVTFVTAPAADFMAKDTGRYDMIFLDGDHSSAAVYCEVIRSLEMLNPGGLILLHDFFLNGTRLFENLEVIYGPYLAFNRLRRESPDLGVVPFSPLPWTTLPGTNNTSLAALVRR